MRNNSTDVIEKPSTVYPFFLGRDTNLADMSLQGIHTKQNKRSTHTRARAHAHTQAHPFDNKET